MDGRVKVKNKTNIKNKNLPFSIYKKMCPIHFMSNFQKNSKDYGEPDITYQLAGCGETPNGVPWWYGEGGYIPKIV